MGLSLTKKNTAIIYGCLLNIWGLEEHSVQDES